MQEQFFTDGQKEKIQNRIIHYLDRNRKALDLTQIQMAKKLGYSLSAYRDFERKGLIENRLHSALEIIAKFSEIEDMSPGDFVNYLTLGALPDLDGGEHDEVKLRKWERILIKTLRKCDQSTRKAWSEAIMNFPNKDLAFLLKAQTVVAKITDKLVLTSISNLLSKVKV